MSASKISFVGKSFLTLKQFSRPEIEKLLWTASDLKLRIKQNNEPFRPLAGKTLATIFQKRSTRTRVSSEVGFSLLGGKPVFLSPDDIHLGVSESVYDSGRVLSGFVDLILARVYGHKVLTDLASASTVPIINGLSDAYHPLQILADLLTLQEHFGRLKGLRIAWVGDGNNITHSFLMACPKLGIDLRVATPKGYECDQSIVSDAESSIKEYIKDAPELMFTNDPKEAVHKADVIVTDTWISMGQEKEKQERLKAFHGYQVTRELCNGANKDWVFLHCLPRKQEEVNDDVFYDEKRSLVWTEAENRMWTVMSVMLHLLKDHNSPKSNKPKFGWD